MRHIAIIVPDGQTYLSSIACIVGAYEIFTSANGYWKETGQKELFKVELAGVSKNTEFVNGLLTVKPHVDISAISKTHLIIIPSVDPGYQKAMNGNKLLIDWIAKQYNNGAEIASMCSGAFMLASAGLLDGEQCSTHWFFADTFQNDVS